MKLLIALVVLGALAVAADAIAEETAEARIGERLSSSVRGADEVDVEIRGRPFLVQAIRGRFRGMDLHLPSVRRGGIEVEDVEVMLDDVEFSAGELIDGSGDVQVGGGTGSGSVTEAGVNAALDEEGIDASITLDGDGATVSAAGAETTVERVAIVDGALEFRSAALGGIRIALPRFVDEVSYRDATVQDSRVLVSIDLPATSIDPGGL